jgi:hypothetical protein
MSQTEKRDNTPREPEIRAGQGRFPWWIWVAIGLWLIYAFFIGPFRWTGPSG